jgi:ATP-dependent Lon protease
MSDLVLPVLPLRGVVLFPAGVLPVAVAPSEIPAVEAALQRGSLFVVGQHDDGTAAPRQSDLSAIGALARVRSVERSPSKWDVVLMGLARARVGPYVSFSPFLEATGRAIEEPSPRDSAEALAFSRRALELVDLAEALLRERPDLPFEGLALLRTMRRRGFPPSHVADLIASYFCPRIQHQLLLETSELTARVERLTRCLSQELEAARATPSSPQRLVRHFRCAVGW